MSFNINRKACTLDQIALGVYSRFIIQSYINRAPTVPRFNQGAGDSVVNKTDANTVLTLFTGENPALN